MHTDAPAQYVTDANLAARQRLWATSRRDPPFALFPWVLQLAGLGLAGAQPHAAVLDVGCGNGMYERALATEGHAGVVVAADLSRGMLEAVACDARAQADAQSLPFASAGFDVVLAPHMLYHVPDVGRAATEAARVLRDDGVLVAVTNGVANLAELRAIVEQAVGTGWTMVRPAEARFSLENGAPQLSDAFSSVERVDCPSSAVVVTDVGALADYVASVADHYERVVDVPWPDVVARVRSAAARAISDHGAIRLGTSVGAFVCRTPMRTKEAV